MKIELAVEAFRFQVEELARNLGRLGRRHADDEYTLYLLSLCGGSVVTLDQLVAPTAAQIYGANIYECGDVEASIEAALADVDDRVARLRGLLGVKAR